MMLAVSRRCCAVACRGVRAASTVAQLPVPAAERSGPSAGVAALLLLGAVGAGAAAGLVPGIPGMPAPVQGTDTTLTNWSNTKEVSTAKFYQPESIAALERLVAWAHTNNKRLRPVGNALSPNGIGFDADGMVNLALCDKVLSLDPAAGRITVQAGARLSVVLDALREHGWTLQNLASIKEQQVGGWIQAGCHGTGAGLPPVEEQVAALRIVTPGRGTLSLSAEADPRLFALAKCGLGALGVVAEVTIQGVRLEPLAERTTVQTARQVRRNHASLLRDSRHLRYMWIPNTDAVVVVEVNPLSKCPAGTAATPLPPASYRLQPLRVLLRRTRPGVADAEIEGMSFADLRDAILAADPLDARHVAACNRAEAEFWRRSQGWRVGDNEAILGFECGGEQWVSEVAFPTGTLANPSLADLAFVEQTLQMIERRRLPAPAPIEQRWTASSAAAMSPAGPMPSDPSSLAAAAAVGGAGAGAGAGAGQGLVHSWVGVIMYLPTQGEAARAAVTGAFDRYREAWQDEVQSKFGAVDHWAKIEAPKDEAKAAALRKRLEARYPVAEFNAARRELDPKNILANPLVDALFPLSGK